METQGFNITMENTKGDNLIFTEGSSQIGLGHIMRCIALYDELEARHLNPRLVIYGDEGVVEAIGNRKYEIDFWYDNWPNYVNAYQIAKPNCIIDSYIAEEKTYFDIQKHCRKALYIDDANRISYPKGIIVNPSLYGNKINYKNKSGQLVLAGPNYVILRKEFRCEFDRIAKDKIDDMIVIMGGSDIWNLTPELIRILKKSKYKNIRKHIVVGNGAANINAIKKLADESNTFLHKNLDARQLCNLISSSDYALTAAGQTTYELIAMQLPFSCVMVADNQRNNVAGLLDNRIINNYLDYTVAQDPRILEKYVIESIMEMNNVNTRNNQIRAMKKINLRRGVKRIVDALV